MYFLTMPVYFFHLERNACTICLIVKASYSEGEGAWNSIVNVNFFKTYDLELDT